MRKTSTKKRTNKRTSKKSIDNKQSKLLSKLENNLNAITEEKYTRVTSAAVIFSNTAPYTQLINSMSIGTTKFTRTGAKLQAKFIDIQLSIYNSNNTFTNDNFVRVLLIVEKPNLGSTAISLTSLYDTSTPTHMTPFNRDTRDFKKRFRILYNKVFNTWNTSNLAQVTFSIKKRLNLLVDYSRGNYGDGRDIDTNAMYLCLFTDKSAASASTLSVKYDGLITYIDS